MAALAPARLQIQGERQSGEDVRSQNTMAVSAIANIVKSSLGPVGLDKVEPLPIHDSTLCSKLCLLTACCCLWT